MRPFLQIEKKNNWGNLEYWVDDFQFKVTSNERFRVQWPNGEVTLESALAEPYIDRVSDHGKEYEVTTEKYFIKTEIRGMEVKIPFENFKVCI